jgi:hypothetical protein
MEFCSLKNRHFFKCLAITQVASIEFDDFDFSVEELLDFKVYSIR